MMHGGTRKQTSDVVPDAAPYHLGEALCRRHALPLVYIGLSSARKVLKRSGTRRKRVGTHRKEPASGRTLVPPSPRSGAFADSAPRSLRLAQRSGRL